MGYFLGNKIPQYDPFWEEDYMKDQPDWWKWFHLGHEDGYATGSSYSRKLEDLEQENESLKTLISANKRLDPEFDEYLKQALAAQEEGRPRSDSVHESQQA